MKKFWGYATNGEFSIGCTGQTVYLFDRKGNEVNKFKDLKYAYMPMISPNGKFFAVKSAEGKFAVYSLETFSLIKKFRFSKSGSQDNGFCFSNDSKYLLNIEWQPVQETTLSAISVYDTENYNRVSRHLFGRSMMITHIESDKETDEYYVLGLIRRENGYGFVAKFNDGITDMVKISESEYNFYRFYKDLEIMGFTEKAYEWSDIDCELAELKNMNHTLSKLQKHYSKQP